MIIPAFRYFLKTVQHKFFVFVAGLKIGVPIWQLIIHDWSKFTPTELFGYGRQFYSKKQDAENWARTWIHHQNHNPHHWEYWITRSDLYKSYRANEPMPMPEKYIKEMLADWMGAGRAYEGKFPENLTDWDWWFKNNQKIVLHPESRVKLLTYISEYFA